MRLFVVVCVLAILLLTGCASNPAKEDYEYCALFVSYSVSEGNTHSFYNDYLFGYRCNPSIKEIAGLKYRLKSDNKISDEAKIFIWFWNTVSYDINVK